MNLEGLTLADLKIVEAKLREELDAASEHSLRGLNFRDANECRRRQEIYSKHPNHKKIKKVQDRIQEIYKQIGL